MNISIAMATYNGARYLQDQLNSFVTQTRHPDELVVCDDASTDSTLDLLTRFKKTAPFKVFIHANNKRIGYVQNFGQAMAYCSGDLICLSDQDDVWLPDKLAEVEAFFSENEQSLLLINDQLLADVDLNTSSLTKLGNYKKFGWGGSGFISGCSTTLRHCLLDVALPIPDIGITHDSWIHWVAGFLDQRFVLDKALQIHRRHGANESDSFVSDPSGVTIAEYLSTAWTSVRRDIRPWLYQRLSMNIELAKRLNQAAKLSESTHPLINTRLDQHLNRLSKQRVVISARLDILNSSWPLSLLYASAALIRGQYKIFGGFSGYLRDCLSARQKNRAT